MLSRDYKDIVGGALLAVFGLIVAVYAATSYDLGTLRRMGPGMFPMALGVILSVFGVALIIPALFREGKRPHIRIFSPLFVLLGVSAFALLVRPFGLIPAILAVVMISSVAELKIRPVSLTILSVAMCVLAWLVFRVGLGLAMPMFRWPF